MVDYRKFKKINALIAQGHFEDARRTLLELQAHYIALYDEVSILKKQVQEFEDILFLSHNLRTEGGQYWLWTGSIKHGPFCKPCYEYTGKLIRLESHKSVWRCSFCGLLHNREPAVRDPLVRQGKIIPFNFPGKAC